MAPCKNPIIHSFSGWPGLLTYTRNKYFKRNNLLRIFVESWFKPLTIMGIIDYVIGTKLMKINFLMILLKTCSFSGILKVIPKFRTEQGKVIFPPMGFWNVLGFVKILIWLPSPPMLSTKNKKNMYITVNSQQQK